MVSNNITINEDANEWKTFASTYTVTDRKEHLKQREEYLQRYLSLYKNMKCIWSRKLDISYNEKQNFHLKHTRYSHNHNYS